MAEEKLIRREKVTIPTYRVGAPDRNPMFLEKRVYQGSSGRVYPYPVIESVSDEPVDCEYDAYFLENEFLEIMVLPELGGRIQRARDKTNNYDFIYHNRVIKPALVGLAGPWISGGIEFNWPQHHRPNTFGPVAARLVKNSDGSETLWCGETDRMYGTRGLHGVTLRPGRAVMEIHGRVYNPTTLPQTFLWWANPAVSVHDDYQSIFPPDVTAVMDHGKRDVSTFPIATGTYYKVDYRPGTDISWYGNIPVPTSYMAYKSNFDFVGGYDHRRQAGLLHVADRHVSPGKKQWTWGCGDFGKAWDRNLTDEDGPYFELMTGVYTDNQPDFAWLMPCEEKRFVQNFLPYQKIGQVHQANTRAAVSLDIVDGVIKAGVYLTERFEVDILVRNVATNDVLHESTLQIGPDTPWTLEIPAPRGIERKNLHIKVYKDQREVIGFGWREVANHLIPKAADPAPPPKEVRTNEELIHWGRHLEQYRHATRDPIYWHKEALGRDSGDMRGNNEVGKLLLRRACPGMAREYLETAVAKSLERNPNPYDGEPLYNLGLCCLYLEDYEAADNHLAKAAWNAAWKAPAAALRGRIACLRGDLECAATILQEAVAEFPRSNSIRELLVTVLRHLKRNVEAMDHLRVLLREDPVNPWGHHEMELLNTDEVRSGGNWMELFGRDANHYLLELIRGYTSAGFYADAADLVEKARKSGHEPNALCLYMVGDVQSARLESLDGVFPNRLEDTLELKALSLEHRDDGNVSYLLGNALYDKMQYEEAIAAWEHAARLIPDFPTVHRNLGLAYFNPKGDAEAARASYEKAFSLDQTDSRVLFELDQLLKRTGESPTARLDLLTRHAYLIGERDDLYLERATLTRLLKSPESALEQLLSRKFHPWEGGEGKVTRLYVRCLLDMALAAIESKEGGKALEFLERAESYPENLSEGKLYGTAENELNYLRGLAWRLLGEEEKSRQSLELATAGLDSPASAWFYNDQPPESIFYQGLALLELDRDEEAERRFRSLVDYGRTHMDDKPEIDYFAVSLPDFLVFEDDLERRNRIHCSLMMALGLIGLERKDEARSSLESVLAMDPSHTEADRQKRLLDSGQK